MAKFKITDNATGRSVVVRGDKAPTPEEAENIFVTAGIKQRNPYATRPMRQDIPNYNEWAMSQKSAPLSEAISTRGNLGAVSGAILNPAEQVVRSGLGAVEGLTQSARALRGDKKAERTVLSGNIPYLSGTQESAIRSKSSLPVAVEGVRQGANIIAYNPATASSVRGNAALGSIRGASAGFGQTYSGQPISEQIGQTLEGATTGALIEGSLPAVGKGVQTTGRAVKRGASNVADATRSGLQTARAGIEAGIERARPYTQGMGERITQGAERLIPEESTRALELAGKYDVDLPLSARRPSGTTEIAEATAVRGLFGGDIAKKINTAFDRVNELQQNLRRTNAPETFETLATGKKVQSAFKKYVDDFTRQASQKYDNIPSLDKVPATANSTHKFLKNTISSKLKSRVKPRDLKFYEDSFQTFFDADTLSAQDLRETLKAVGSRIDDNADIVAKSDMGALKKFYSVLEEDLERTLSGKKLPKSKFPKLNITDTRLGAKAPQLNTKEILKQIREADRFYKGNIKKIRSQIGRNITRLDPEKVLESVVKPNNPTGVKLLKDVLGDEGIEPIRESLVQKIVYESLDRTGELIDPIKLKNKINKYGYSTLEQLLDKKQFDNLKQILDQAEELAELKQLLTKSQKVAQGSQTGFIASNILAGGGLAILNPLNLIPYLGGQYTLAKIVGSEQTLSSLINSAKKTLKNAPIEKIKSGVKGAKAVGTATEKARKATQSIKKAGSKAGSNIKRTAKTVDRARPTFTRLTNVAVQNEKEK